MSGRSRGTLRERFYANAAAGDGCWLWMGTRDSKGYGVLKVYPQRMIKAHRLSWELHKGAIPSGRGYHGTVVMHACDNPSCVNPAHLAIGTTGDNNADRDRKGRAKPPRGERSSFARLTEAQVRSLRDEYDHLPHSSTGLRKREGSVPQLAARYGVSPGCVRLICQRKTWSHV